MPNLQILLYAACVDIEGSGLTYALKGRFQSANRANKTRCFQKVVQNQLFEAIVNIPWRRTAATGSHFAASMRPGCGQAAA